MSHISSPSHKNSLRFGSRTDIGRVRDHNEDSLIVAPPLFAVADGMGGHAAGEVASEVAVTCLLEHAPSQADTRALGEAVEQANRAVILAASKQKGRAGMGTTLTAAMINQEKLALAHVGDSRAYLLHQGVLQQITRDHSLVAELIEAGDITEEQARVHPDRSRITRALGSNSRMVPDLYEITVEAGDRLLLCSDGLSSMLMDKDMEYILSRTRDPQDCVDALTEAALSAGGLDNITAIVVDLQGASERTRRKAARKGRLWIGIISFLLAALILGALGGAYAYIHNTAYLIAEDGKVAVYRGRPDTLFGAKLSWLDHTTDISIDELRKINPGIASRLSYGGTQVDSLAEANATVEAYQKLIDEAREEAPADSEPESKED